LNPDAGAFHPGAGVRVIDELPFEQIWLVDFEFRAIDGGVPIPICLVAHEVKSGETKRVWRNQFDSHPPYRTDEGVLFVAYYASAEIGCHLALGWAKPARILDLFAEFRNHTNGDRQPDGTPVKAGLLDAMARFGLPFEDLAHKEAMRDLILHAEDIDQHRADVLDYCESDVSALRALLPALIPFVDLPHALLRGRYMAAAASIEHAGIPIDADLHRRLRENWLDLKACLIADVDHDFGVYDGTTFKRVKFDAYLSRNAIMWPRMNGEAAIDDETFKEMALRYPALDPLRQLRKTLSAMDDIKLIVGPDERNRTLLSAFRSVTGRNQPSTTKFIFGLPSWLRSLIKPAQGRAVAYIDWSQQEFGIAAALSGDVKMMDAYRSGDPYLSFAIHAGAAPADATKVSHKAVRDQFKAAVLAVQYQMTSFGLARRIGRSILEATYLLDLHKRTFSDFWVWSRRAENFAMLKGFIFTVFGWKMNVGDRTKYRTIPNFPMQANGAEMLRLACCMATEQGINVVAPVHDAVLIEDSADTIDITVIRMQAIMAEASRVVLNGFELGSDVKIVRYPDRYVDEKGAEMFERVMRLLSDLEVKSATKEVVVAA
jgi:DNA polymerase-1